MASIHEQIRWRTTCFARRAHGVRQQTRVSEDALVAAEARYVAGATLREIAPEVGISRQRLASLLRVRGVRLRRTPPSDAEVEEMVRRYAAGESLERIGSRLGFSAGTVRNWLTARDVVMRDCHGRER